MESRWIWRVLAAPGIVWLSVFFLIAMYTVLCVALGNQNTLNEPIPYWNPLDWNVGYLLDTLKDIWNRGPFFTVFIRTVAYVVLAMVLSLRSATRSPTTRRATPAAGGRWCCCCSSCRSGSTT